MTKTTRKTYKNDLKWQMHVKTEQCKHTLTPSLSILCFSWRIKCIWKLSLKSLIYFFKFWDLAGHWILMQSLEWSLIYFYFLQRRIFTWLDSVFQLCQKVSLITCIPHIQFISCLITLSRGNCEFKLDNKFRAPMPSIFYFWMSMLRNHSFIRF